MAWTSTKDSLVEKYGWCAFRYGTDISGCEDIKAAPAAGNLYIKHLFISCVSAITVTIGEGETAGAVTTAYTTFEFVATSGAPIDVHFQTPLKLAATTAFTADASGAGDVTVICEGYTK